MNIHNNPQLKLAHDFVQFTGKNIFLTGKAGTGKTTFLQNLRKHLNKRIVVVAPTGVAAINASGVTIHSFFQLSFGPQIPGFENLEYNKSEKKEKFKRFSKEKINIIKSMDLLIIDEISMVRADLLDGIDNTLRRFRNKNLAFGGVQLLMIGDLQQLAPVVSGDEQHLLRKYYDTPFFFSSKALQKKHYVTIELLHVYRQKDKKFINLLNKIRDNKIDKEVIDKLNARYKSNFNPDNEGYIILTTHNNKAKQINDSKLERIENETHTFEAEISGNFPEYIYPTDNELKLKVDSQVMFVKNDPNHAKEYYNGKIGIITEIYEDIITVNCEGDDEAIKVRQVEWKKMKYKLDNESKEIKESVEGTFNQYPLKLAWAITIHKSQGLTFEKAIIDAQAAFAHGQVYVALSRCKTLEGMILSTPIETQGVKLDPTVKNFTKNYEENQPNSSELESSKKEFQQELLIKLFDFNNLQKYIFYSIKIIKDNAGSIEGKPIDVFLKINKSVKEDIINVSAKFQKQITQLFSQKTDAEEDKNIQERVKKAATYFYDRIKNRISDELNEISVETDNKAVRKSLKDVLNKLLKETQFKLSCLQSCQNGFVVKNYLEVKAKASIDDPLKPNPLKKLPDKPSTDITHPELHKQLKTWRNNKAKELDKKVYMIIQLKSIGELSNKLPVTLPALKTIKGLGKRKIEDFGYEILEIIITYCKDRDIDSNTYEEPEIIKKPTGKNTKQISFDLWKSGKKIEDIASERELVTATIEGHLAYFVGTGEIPVDQFVNTEKTKIISDYLNTEEFTSLTEAKSALGDNISYSDLKFVIAHFKFLNEKK